jgi:phage gp16-like protein
MMNPLTSHRRSMLAKIHLARKELRLIEDDYRAILLKVTGRSSAKLCTDAELSAVIGELKRIGFRPQKAAGSRPATHPGAAKARAMWISLHQLGAIKNPSEQALEAFARRQLGCERLQWADQSLVYRLIEALKAIAERHGWSQSMENVRASEAATVLRRRLVIAQHAKLQREGLVPRDWTVRRAVYEFGGVDMASILMATVEQLEMAAKVLGEKLHRPTRPMSMADVA